MLCLALSKGGFAVTKVASAGEAFDVLGSESFHAVILDITLLDNQITSLLEYCHALCNNQSWNPALVVL